jgi:D-amino-acid dehydrogenase
LSEIAVIGAGVTGINAAYFLAKKGHKVTVFENEKYAGMATSFSNGAQISACNSETWNNLEIVSRGLKSMFKSDAPLYIRPFPDFSDLSGTFSKYMWLSEFFFASLSGDYKKNSEKIFSMALKSRELYLKIIEEENLEFDFLQKGILQYFESETDLEKTHTKKEWIESMGVEWDRLSFEEIVKLEPALANNKSIVGGIYTKSDATGDIHKYCVELGKVLKNKYSVIFKYGQPVQDISGQDKPILVTENYEHTFDKIVISAGVTTEQFKKKFGDSFRIYPAKGYSITIDLDEESQKAAPFVSLKDESNKLVCSRLGNRLRVAGTVELDGYNKDIRENRVKPLLKWVNNVFPKISTENYLPWTGLRPMTPNMMPIVQASKRKNIYYNSGHGILGWTLGTATAKSLSDLISD